MKKVSLLITLCLLLALSIKAQPTLQNSVDFNDNTMGGWTANNATYVQIKDSAAVALDGKYLVIQPNRTQDSAYLLSPVINVEAGQDVRLEFCHIPMLPSGAGTTPAPGYVEIIANGQKTTLGAAQYTYNVGGFSTGFTGSFHRNSYWSSASNFTTVKKEYWKHESFTISASSVLHNETSFRIRFVVPKKSTTACAGWYMDNIKVFVGQTGQEVEIPQIKNLIEYPNMREYPNCGDANVTFRLLDRNGALPSVSDHQMYVVYYNNPQQNGYSPDTVYFDLNTDYSTNDVYTATIPFTGIDSTIVWQAVINDAQGNTTYYPFTGIADTFKYIRPCVSDAQMYSSNLSSQPIMFSTNGKKAGMFQMRYSVQELLAAGYTAGRIGGVYVNLTAKANTTLSNFSITMHNVDPDKSTNTTTYYSEDAVFVLNEPSFVLPPVGWAYIAFDENVPFMWDGKSDIIIRTCYTNSSASGLTTVSCVPTSNAKYATYKYESSNEDIAACTSVFTPGDGVANYKPNLRFNFVNICYFNDDAGVREDTIISPTPFNYCGQVLPTVVSCQAGTPTSLQVMLRNDGLDTLTNLKVKWDLDAGRGHVDANTLDSTSWSGVLLPLDANHQPVDTAKNFVCTNNFLPTAGIHTLYVWVEMPNESIIDWNKANDTAEFKLIVTSGAMNGIYAVGNVSGVSSQRTFASLDDAFLMLAASGVNGPCTFKIESKEYTGSWKFPSCISGLSATNTITFVSQSNDTLATFRPQSLDNSYVFDLSNSKYLNFEKIKFSPVVIDTFSTGVNSNIDVIKMSSATSNINFTSCLFDSYVAQTPTTTAKSMINMAAASNVNVNNCYFGYPSTYHIYSSGLSPINPTKNITIKYSDFAINGHNKTQSTTNSIYVQYSRKLALENNYFYTNFTDSIDNTIDAVRYATLLLNIDTGSVVKNVYKLKSYSALSLTSVNKVIIANNRLSVWNTIVASGTISSYGINLSSGSNNTIAYNDIYAKALNSFSKKAYAVNLGMTGQTLTNNLLKNNIFLSDGYGYAASYRPSSTDATTSVDISNNFYYKTFSIEDQPMFSFNGATSTTTENWISSTSDTLSFYTQDPMFLDWDDLTTTNTLLCAAGTAIADVTDDAYSLPRPTTYNPCIGSHEFLPPPSNIFVQSVGVNAGDFDGVSTYTSCDFQDDSVFVYFSNISSDTIPANSLKLKFSVGSFTSNAYTFAPQVLPDSLYYFVFPITHNFASTSGTQTFTLKAWSVLAADTVNNNDTATATIISLYQVPAASPVNVNSNYGYPATVTVNSTDSVYWYYSMEDDNYFYKGQSFQTPALYSDTTYYFSKKTEIPNLKITEVMVTKTANKEGQTNPLPSYITTTAAIEISNLGNTNLDMTGYQLVYFKPSGSSVVLTTSNASNMITYTFPDNYILRKNSCVVLIPKSSTGVDDTIALPITTTIKPTATSKGGLALKNAQGTYIDAVAFNGAKYDNSVGIPNSVWHDSNDTIKLTNAVAGFIRTSSSGNTAAAWSVSSASNVMTMGTYNNNLTTSTDNGCYGFKAPYNIHMINIPQYDPGITSSSIVGLVDSSACNLSCENISIKVANTGLNPLTNIPLVCNYYEGNTLLGTLHDTIRQTLNVHDSISFTFSECIDLSAYNSTRNIKIQTYTNYTGDIVHRNDTSTLNITSLLTPLQPAVNDTSITYASSVTFTPDTLGSKIVWYEDSITHTELARGYYTTDVLYQSDTVYVGALLQSNINNVLGTDTAVVGTTAALGYPSPLNIIQKHTKEQYLITSDLLTSAGYGEGNINALDVYVAVVKQQNNTTPARLTEYTIRIGTTNEGSINAWQTNLTDVYYEDTLAFTTSSTGWKHFDFDNSFYWDGVSNLVVEVCFNSTTTTGKIRTATINTDYQATYHYHHNTTDACTYTGNALSTFNKLPYMKFDMNVFGCQSSRKPVVITVGNPPSCDAAIVDIYEPAGTTIMSGISTDVKVEIKNYGADTLSSATINWSVNSIAQTPYTYDGSLPKDSTQIVNLGSYTFSSGAVVIEAYITQACDTIHSNDTISKNYSACIGNNTTVTSFTVGGNTSDYATLSEVASSLNVSGLCGPVIYNIASGTYTDKIDLSQIEGSSSVNTVIFRGDSTNPPTIIGTASNQGSLVLNMENTSYISFENIIFKTVSDTVKKLVNLNTCENITFSNVTFTSVGTATTLATTLVNLEGENQGITFDNNTFKNSNIALLTETLTTGVTHSDITVRNSYFDKFLTGGILLNSVNGAIVTHNYLRSYASTIINAYAIKLNTIEGQSELSSNRIYLTESTKERMGIILRDCQMSEISPLMVVNNAISIIGTQSKNTYGFDIDSSNNVSLFYNTVMLRAGNNNNKARCTYIQSDNQNIMVRNNNFDNQSRGYAYYVESANNPITVSNNNNYSANGTRLAFWGANKDNLTALCAANSMDDASDTIENVFESDSVLALLYPTDIVRAAEPLEEVTVDILDNLRPVSPRPTMGAYEYIFDSIDAGVISIQNPVSKTKYLEQSPINLQVIIKNFGNYSLDNITLVAELKYSEDDPTNIQRIEEQYVGFLTSLDTTHYTFTTPLMPELNNPLTDSLFLRVYTMVSNDCRADNDTIKMRFLSVPAKNAKAVSVAKQGTGVAKCGENMRTQAIVMTLKNEGNVDMTSSDVLNLTYEVLYPDGSLKATATEALTFPYTDNNASPVQTYTTWQNGQQFQYSFAQTVDLYPPEGQDTITWRIRAWVSYDADHVKNNDTTAFQSYHSIASPVPPVAINDTIFYGTRGYPQATHATSLSINWYDPNSNTLIYHPSNYNTSTTFETDTLFADTSFLVRVFATGSSPCPSQYDTVRVIIRERCQTDMSALAVVSPTSGVSNQYLDTVAVRVVNYSQNAQTNFNITYELTPATPANSDPVAVVTETVTASVLPDAEYIYVFDSLAPIDNRKCIIRAWVSATNDCTHINDTTRKYTITPANDSRGSVTINDGSSLDITRVQLSTMDNTSIAGDDTYTDFTTTVEPALMFKGIRDTLYVTNEPSSSVQLEEDEVLAGWMKVWVDLDRSGSLDRTKEQLYNPTNVNNWGGDTVIQGRMNKIPITIPDTVRSGLMRMRIILAQDDVKHYFGPYPGSGNDSINKALAKGEIEDYYINVLPAEQVNAELMRFVTPERLTSESHQDIIVRLRNAGLQTLTSATITLRWDENAPIVYNWTGNLPSAECTDITIATLDLNYGLNNLVAYIDVAGDNYKTNDTISLNANIFNAYTLTYATDFDTQNQEDFFAYEINENKPSNCWQFGTPDDTANTYITSAYSEPNCWKTNLSGNYPANNTSILYSPVYDIHIIKPDTLSFMIKTRLASGSNLVVEYLNYKGNWTRLGGGTDPVADSNTIYDANWYKNSNGWTGNRDWTKMTYSLDHLVTDMGNELQIRFKFKSSNAVSEGVAIDDFQLLRGQRDIDLGVVHVELTPEALPNYGQYFYPKVNIANFGRDTVNGYSVCYMSQDMFIPQCEYLSNIPIAAGDTIEYTFTNGHYLNFSMPDPFQIVAFTRMSPQDVYTDNDSAWATCVIGPLMNDAAIVSIEEPSSDIVSNDDIEVKIRVKNYGLTPITELPVGYAISNGQEVLETIHFNPALNNTDEYVYTFSQGFHSSFGTVNLKSWVGLPTDTYHDNDTLYRYLQGTNTQKDLEAKYISIDDGDENTLGVQLVFYNRSNVSIDNITVGYYINGDPTTMVTETYRLGTALEAGSYGYHLFNSRLTKNMYNSVCAFVSVADEANTSNDTTCSIYLGYRDGVIDSIMIEETQEPTCLVQIRAHNGGTLGGRTMVTGKYVLNGDWQHPVAQTFEWTYDEPRPEKIQYMSFTTRIPRSDDHQYDIVAWIEYPNDINLSNDTTRLCMVRSYVGLDTVENNGEFTLQQNRPNPFRQHTDIDFSIPQAGNINFYITNNLGQIVYRHSAPYSQGSHTISFDGNLPQGMYYYILEYNNQRKYKKMVVVN